jgi:hypothetical protein
MTCTISWQQITKQNNTVLYVCGIFLSKLKHIKTKP